MKAIIMESFGNLNQKKDGKIFQGIKSYRVVVDKANKKDVYLMVF